MHNLHPHARPWSASGLFRASGLSVTDRVRDVLDNVTLLACSRKGFDVRKLTQEQIQESVRGYWVDVSQCIMRHAFAGDREPLPTFTTSTDLYSFSADRSLVGREMLCFHGHSRELQIPPDVPRGTSKDLAGEGMTLPCLGCVLWSLFICKQFPSVNTAGPSS